MKRYKKPQHRPNYFKPDSMKQNTINTVVLYNSATRQWLRFSSPKQVIKVSNIHDVVPALRHIEQLVETKGLYAAGFVSYESAPAFDEALQVKKTDGTFPLMWFGLYKKPTPIVPHFSNLSHRGYKTGVWRPSVRLCTYKKNISRIKNFISRGETYQVNYTFRLTTVFKGSEWPFFVDLVSGAQAGYPAFIDTGRFVICSASPELFFQLNHYTLVSRPMKGTVPRGRFLLEDQEKRQWLAVSEKNRAENIMIVDMIRNDMGRIADTGSVRVKSLFTCERYPTVWQTTSTVESQTRASIADIFSALFPCASITGAPKVSTTNIISRLETSPRRIYTGCIGFIAPKRKAVFNVAIRTALIDRKNGSAEYGVGGGVLWPSKSLEEYNECLVKAAVLSRPMPQFSLLESILWTPAKGYYLLLRHLKRLADAALYFGFTDDIAAIKKKLALFAQSLAPRPYKVRLLLAENGNTACEAMQLSAKAQRAAVHLKLCRAPVDSTDCFLFHKTTNRRVYEQAAAGRSGCDDVVLWNERGEITETCTSNIVIMKRGRLFTPKMECGLLAGTFRAHLLARKKIHEGIITKDDLKSAEKIYVINSVRKWRKAVIIGAD
jgi:para-aminobenzoate synthetase / 4-amino-4-deoxychorismate lyase